MSFFQQIEEGFFRTFDRDYHELCWIFVELTFSTIVANCVW